MLLLMAENNICGAKKAYHQRRLHPHAKAEGAMISAGGGVAPAASLARWSGGGASRSGGLSLRRR